MKTLTDSRNIFYYIMFSLYYYISLYNELSKYVLSPQFIAETTFEKKNSKWIKWSNQGQVPSRILPLLSCISPQTLGTARAVPAVWLCDRWPMTRGLGGGTTLKRCTCLTFFGYKVLWLHPRRVSFRTTPNSFLVSLFIFNRPRKGRCEEGPTITRNDTTERVFKGLILFRF